VLFAFQKADLERPALFACVWAWDVDSHYQPPVDAVDHPD